MRIVSPDRSPDLSLACPEDRDIWEEGNIIEALSTNTFTGEIIAEKAGYPYNSNFKATLSAIRKRGIIGNKYPGYFLLPKYLYLLDKPD